MADRRQADPPEATPAVIATVGDRRRRLRIRYHRHGLPRTAATPLRTGDLRADVKRNAMMIACCVMVGFAVLIGAYVRRYDRPPPPGGAGGADPERGWVLAVAAAMGFITMAAAGRIEDGLLRAMDAAADHHATRAMVVAVVEELAKLATIAAVFTLAPRRFGAAIDGVIVGTFVGLGAAVNESMLYLRVADPSAAALGGEVVRLFAHALLGGVIGYAMGGAVERGVRHGGVRGARAVALRIRVLLGYVLAVVIHAGWNGIAYVHAASDVSRSRVLALMALLMMMWALMVSVAGRRSAVAVAMGASDGAARSE